jgi:hypothetical protein
MKMSAWEVTMDTRNVRIRTSVTIGILILWMAPAGWARTRPETLPELAARSQWTGIARCIEASAVRERPGGMIFTVYRFERLAGVSGAAVPEAFTLRIAGGTADGLRVTIPDAPRFDPGRAYLVCLAPKQRGGGLLVCGAGQGVLPARQDGQGRWEVAVPQRLAPAAAKMPAAAPGGVDSRRWMRLEELKSLLTAGVGGGGQ